MYAVSVLLLHAACATSLPLPSPEYNYKEALKLSLLFFEAQRSGKLPQNNRIPWRRDSGLNDRGLDGEDLTGGYYDAADYVKFGFTIAYTMTVLSWGMIAHEEVYRHIGQYETTLDAIKWGTDYLIKCHVTPNEFYAQVGDFPVDHKFWGRPEELNTTRLATKVDKDNPGSDVAGEAAAALAAASIVFSKVNKTYSQELLRHGEELFHFAQEHSGLFLESYPNSRHYHENDRYEDELAWAAMWLYKATKSDRYKLKAVSLYEDFKLSRKPKTFFYNNKIAGVQLLMAQEIGDQSYKKDVKIFCNYSMKEETRTPKGLVYISKQGTLAHAANIAFICLEAATLDGTDFDLVEFAREQLHYILGSTGFSYLIGYGDKYPRKPHHAASSCNALPAKCDWADYYSTEPNPQILYGALVSGPNQSDHYEDVRDEFAYSDVTIDYNAGLQGLLAGMLQRDLVQRRSN